MGIVLSEHLILDDQAFLLISSFCFLPNQLSVLSCQFEQGRLVTWVRSYLGGMSWVRELHDLRVKLMKLVSLVSLVSIVILAIQRGEGETWLLVQIFLGAL